MDAELTARMRRDREQHQIYLEYSAFHKEVLERIRKEREERKAREQFEIEAEAERGKGAFI